MCVPQGGIETVLSSWIGVSCDLARKEENGPLSDALLAISIQKTEGIWSKVMLCQSALELYQRALGALRNSLQGPIATKQHELKGTPFVKDGDDTNAKRGPAPFPMVE